MKKILGLFFYSGLFVLFSTTIYAAKFKHPMDFKGSDSEKNQVIAYIIENVKETYSSIGMDDASTLRMMEKEELNSFKKLTAVKNRKLLDSVIQQYCGIGMCGYDTILMMYNEESKASKEKLEW